MPPCGPVILQRSTLGCTVVVTGCRRAVEVTGCRLICGDRWTRQQSQKLHSPEQRRRRLVNLLMFLRRAQSGREDAAADEEAG
jgi:hypothetical protein